MMVPRFLVFLSLVGLVQADDAPFLVAHRGASGEAPENTLPAFKLAWEQGADAIEGDFHLTADGRIICLHDGDTGKTCGVKHLVAKTNFATLRKLDAGSWFDEKFAGTKIPTLEEVAATVPPGKKFFIEVKSSPKIVPTLIDVLEKSKLKEEQIVVISFQSEVIAAVEKARPGWKCCWLTSIKGDQATQLKPTTASLLQTLRDLKCDGVSTSANPLISPQSIADIRKAGFEYHTWTINDPQVAKRFLTHGARSITTDFPGKMRQGLE